MSIRIFQTLSMVLSGLFSRLSKTSLRIAFLLRIRSVTRVLSYVNAGHNAPMVLRWKDNECKIFTLESTGPPLGLLEGSQWTSQALQLEADDVLVITRTE